MSTDVTSGSARAALRRDRRLHLWIAVKGLSDAGDAAWTIALAWTAVHLAGPAVAGLVVAAGTVPRAAVLLLGGVVADRSDPRRTVLLANTARLAVLLGVVAVSGTGHTSVGLLLAAAVLFGVSDAVHEPSAAALVRQLVRPEDLAAYAGASQTASRLGTMGGAAVGGVLVASVGLTGSAAADALTFGVLVAVLGLLLPPRFALARSEGSEPALRQVVAGLQHLRTTPATRRLVLTLSGLNLAVTPALGLGLSLRARSEGWGAGAVGALEAAVGLGAAAATLLVTRRRPADLTRWGFGALVVQGAGIVLLGLGPLVATFAAAALIGVTAGVASALLSAVFLATVDERFLGRTSAIQRLGDDVLMPAAMAAFGALAAATTITLAFAVFGGAMAALMVRTLLATGRAGPSPARHAEA